MEAETPGDVPLGTILNAKGKPMLHSDKPIAPKGQGVTRRELLRVGGLGLLGVTLADWWRGRDVQASPSPRSSGREPSCIFIFLSGGPSHLETFDPKPNAPVNIRGPYGTIRTNVPGIQIGELLPAMAQHMDKCAILRSMTSRDEHAGMTMMSGGSKAAASYGAVLNRIKGPGTSCMPPFAQVGASGYLPRAATLGTAYAPILLSHPPRRQVKF